MSFKNDYESLGFRDIVLYGIFGIIVIVITPILIVVNVVMWLGGFEE